MLPLPFRLSANGKDGWNNHAITGLTGGRGSSVNASGRRLTRSGTAGGASSLTRPRKFIVKTVASSRLVPSHTKKDRKQ